MRAQGIVLFVALFMGAASASVPLTVDGEIDIDALVRGHLNSSPSRLLQSSILLFVCCCILASSMDTDCWLRADRNGA